MKYSIIVPIYKVEQYLVQCIESVVIQTYTNWELILVDDGSPDNCPMICDEYAQKDSRIKVVHKKNGGLVSARKAGLEVATGDYAICLDGDDFLHKDCLYLIEDKIKMYDPDVICFGKYIYSSNKSTKAPISGYSFGYYEKERLEKDFFPTYICDPNSSVFPSNLWAKAYKRNLYHKYQCIVPNEVSMGEDGACTRPLLANASSMFLMSECLYYYRQIPTSMTKERKPLSWDNYDLIYRIYEREIDLTVFGFKDQIYRLRTHNLFNICMSQFYGVNSYKNVVKEIKNRFDAHPEYDEYINNSSFTSVSLNAVKLILKYRLFCIMKFYASFRSSIKGLMDVFKKNV